MWMLSTMLSQDRICPSRLPLRILSYYVPTIRHPKMECCGDVGRLPALDLRLPEAMLLHECSYQGLIQKFQSAVQRRDPDSNRDNSIKSRASFHYFIPNDCFVNQEILVPKFHICLIWADLNHRLPAYEAGALTELSYRQNASSPVWWT